MSDKVYDKKYSIPNTDYQVAITIRQIATDRYLVYGKLQDSNGNAVTNVHTMRRSSKTLAEAKSYIPGLCYALSGKVPSGESSVAPRKSSKQMQNAIDVAVKEMLDKGVVFHTPAETGSKKNSWNKDTHRTVYTYWLNHGISALLLRMAKSEDPQHELEQYRAKAIQDTLEHGRSRGNRSRATETVDINLKRSKIRLDYLRIEHPELPAVDLTEGILFAKSIPEEQIKALPEGMCLYITHELEARIPQEPKEVLCTVLMYDTALRTAEAAGIKIKCIIFYENYAVILVESQEKNGERKEWLKTDNAYRIVVTSYWGKEMLRRCLNVLDLNPDDESLLLSGEYLSRWIRGILFSYSKELVETAERVQRTNPDYDEEGKPVYDVSAYVLRRNAASRWLNYDGLSHDEIDILLGHKEKGQRPEIYLHDETHQREIAAKLERYVYNPDITRNPAFCPLQLTPGTQIDLKAYPCTRLVNTSDVPLHVHIDTVACIPAEVITEQVPAGSTEDPICRSERLKPASRIVIGSNLSTFWKKE